MIRLCLSLGQLVLLSTFAFVSTSASTEPCASGDLAWGIYCPPDHHASCIDNLNDLGQFGWAYVEDYSGTHYLYNPTVSHHLSGCNTGHITRTWTAYNPYSGTHHSCSQTIYVGGGQNGSFGEEDIHWPDSHVNLTGCNPNVNPYGSNPDLAPPTWDHVACSQVAVSYSDQLFTVNGDCKKIIRTWKVLDWCQHDPYTGKGKWSFEQTIKIINNEVPSFTCPADVTMTSFNCRDAYVYVDPVQVDPSSCGGYYSVTNNSPYADSNGADISGTYPVGKHKVKLTVHFGCGYRRHCYVDVIVDNKKAPTPYCYHTLTTALMPIDTDGDGVIDDGMVEIWAEDLDRGSFAHCGAGPVQFSFSSDVNDKSRSFSCAHAGVNQVDMWVTDRKGNQDYCTVNLVVQNNNANIPDCEPRTYSHAQTPLSLAGNVMLPDLSPVADASLELVDLSLWIPKYRVDSIYEVVNIDSFYNASGEWVYIQDEVLTIDSVMVRPTDHPTLALLSGKDGTYTIDSMLALEGEYLLKGMGAPVQPLTLDDAYALISHVIGLEPFDSPYQYIAADVDQDQDVDMRDFRQLYYHVRNGSPMPYPNKVVLVDADYEWEAPAEALTYCPDNVHFETAGDHVDGVNWYAVQIGKLSTPSVNTKTLANALDRADLDQEEVMELRNAIGVVEGVRAFPNPFDNQLQFQITAQTAGRAHISLYALDGRLLMEEHKSIRQGENTVSLDSHLKYSGIVIYEVRLADELYTGRLLRID